MIFKIGDRVKINLKEAAAGKLTNYPMDTGTVVGFYPTLKRDRGDGAQGLLIEFDKTGHKSYHSRWIELVEHRQPVFKKQPRKILLCKNSKSGTGSL